jgi:hypothetical protein
MKGSKVKLIYFLVFLTQCKMFKSNKSEVNYLKDTTYGIDTHGRGRFFFLTYTPGQNLGAIVPIVCRERPAFNKKVFYYDFTSEEGLVQRNLEQGNLRWKINHFHSIFQKNDEGQDLCEVSGAFDPLAVQMVQPASGPPNFFNYFGSISCPATLLASWGTVKDFKKSTIELRAGNNSRGLTLVGLSFVKNPKMIASLASSFSSAAICVYHLSGLKQGVANLKELKTLEIFDKYMSQLVDDVTQILMNQHAPLLEIPHIPQPSEEEKQLFIHASSACFGQSKKEDSSNCTTHHNILNEYVVKMFNFIDQDALNKISSSNHYHGIDLNALLNYKAAQDLSRLLTQHAQLNRTDKNNLINQNCNFFSGNILSRRVFIDKERSDGKTVYSTPAIRYNCENTTLATMANIQEAFRDRNAVRVTIMVSENGNDSFIPFSSDPLVERILAATPSANTSENSTSGSTYMRAVRFTNSEKEQRCYLFPIEEMIPIASSCRNGS